MTHRLAAVRVSALAATKAIRLNKDSVDGKNTFLGSTPLSRDFGLKFWPNIRMFFRPSKFQSYLEGAGGVVDLVLRPKFPLQFYLFGRKYDSDNSDVAQFRPEHPITSDTKMQLK